MKPLSVVREDAPRARTCGECTACCRVLGVPELMKPRDTACSNLKKGKRCSIYAERPLTCQEYECLWLQNWFGQAKDRPDRIGVIFDAAEPILNYLFKETGLSVVIAREVWPGAHKQKHAWSMIRAVANRYPIIYMGTGLPGLIALRPRQELALAAAFTKLDAMSDEELKGYKLRALADYDLPIKAMTMPSSELRRIMEATPHDELKRVLDQCHGSLPLIFDVCRKTGTVTNVRIPPPDMLADYAANPKQEKFKRLAETDETFTQLGAYEGVDVDLLRAYSRLHEAKKEEDKA